MLFQIIKRAKIHFNAYLEVNDSTWVWVHGGKDKMSVVSAFYLK